MNCAGHYSGRAAPRRISRRQFDAIVRLYLHVAVSTKKDFPSRKLRLFLAGCSSIVLRSDWTKVCPLSCFFSHESAVPKLGSRKAKVQKYRPSDKSKCFLCVSTDPDLKLKVCSTMYFVAAFNFTSAVTSSISIVHFAESAEELDEKATAKKSSSCLNIAIRHLS